MRRKRATITPYNGTMISDAAQVTTQRSAVRSRPMMVPTVSRTGRTAKYPAMKQKNRQKAASTAGISRSSMGAILLSRRPSGEDDEAAMNEPCC